MVLLWLHTAITTPDINQNHTISQEHMVFICMHTAITTSINQNQK
jgi:hypothetical protein